MKIFRSIRWRVQAWHSLILILIVSILGILFYFHERDTRLNLIDHALHDNVTLLYPRFHHQAMKGRPGGDHGRLGQSGGQQGSQHRRESHRGRGTHHRGHGPMDDVLRDHPKDPYRENAERGEESKLLRFQSLDELELDLTSEGLFFGVWFRSGVEPYLSKNTPQSLNKPVGAGSEESVQYFSDRDYRIAFGSNPLLECVVVGKPVSLVDQELKLLAWQIAGGCTLVILVAMTLGWILTGFIVTPFQKMKSATLKVANGDLHVRVSSDVHGGETGELANALNETFEKLEASFTYQRQFTADASHELRSPIAAMVMETQVALSRDRDSDYYKKSLEACGRNLEKLRASADNLLDLSKLDAGVRALNKKPCDLAEIVESSLARVKGLLEEHSVTLDKELNLAEAAVDAPSIEQVIVNLVSNAVIHTNDGVQIRLATGLNKGVPYVSVEDNGPGVAPEHHDRIFQRFFRSNESRRKGAGSSGLGLAISSTIVEQHGGEIQLRSEKGNGCDFVVTLPRL